MTHLTTSVQTNSQHALFLQTLKLKLATDYEFKGSLKVIDIICKIFERVIQVEPSDQQKIFDQLVENNRSTELTQAFSWLGKKGLKKYLPKDSNLLDIDLMTLQSSNSATPNSTTLRNSQQLDQRNPQSNILELEDLSKAVERGNLEEVKLLTGKNPKLLTHANQGGWSFLHLAAYNRRLEVARILIEKEPTLLSIRLEDGASALYIAAELGHLEMVKLLIEKKRELLLCCNKYGASPLYVASRKGHLEVVKLLAKEEPKLLSMCKKNGWSSLHIAIEMLQLKVAEFLLEQKPDLSELKTDKGHTPLSIAKTQQGLLIVNNLMETISQS